VYAITLIGEIHDKEEM